jgi:hypothetical protein
MPEEPEHQMVPTQVSVHRLRHCRNGSVQCLAFFNVGVCKKNLCFCWELGHEHSRHQPLVHAAEHFLGSYSVPVASKNQQFTEVIEYRSFERQHNFLGKFLIWLLYAGRRPLDSG